MGYPDRPSIAQLRKILSDNAQQDIFETHRTMFADLKSIISSPSSTKTEIENAKLDIKDHEFIENIVTFEQYKRALEKSSFWANEWAIGLIEKQLHIKFIILDTSEEDINCGTLTDLSEDEIPYIPKGYIILEHVGLHYTLVSYNGKTFFKTLSELPESLIRLIKEKRPPNYESCSNVGLFRYIPELHGDKISSSSKVKSGTGKLTRKKKKYIK